MNCKDCKYCGDVGHANWGYCYAPIPGWVEELNRQVFYIENHSRNYANICDLYNEKIK